jgi:two-component system, cell cycle sensor histidine kinase and response regulator CckA
VLPQMNGRILADRLTELRPRVKVLFMSGYTDSAIVHHGRLDLGVSFLHKPFSPATLARMVRAILEA